MQLNPYESPESKAENQPTPSNDHALNWVAAAVVGGLAGLVGSFPFAALTAMFFRFPIPFAGYKSGPEAFFPSFLAAGLYLLLGGAMLQVSLGACAGAAAYSRFRRRSNESFKAIIVAGLLSALPGVLVLSILDWIIGPW